MSIVRMKASIAIGLAGAITASLAATSWASSRQLREFAQPNAPPETINRPVCWTEDGYERWLRCVGLPDTGLRTDLLPQGGQHGL